MLSIMKQVRLEDAYYIKIAIKYHRIIKEVYDTNITI